MCTRFRNHDNSGDVQHLGNRYYLYSHASSPFSSAKKHLKSLHPSTQEALFTLLAKSSSKYTVRPCPCCHFLLYNYLETHQLCFTCQSNRCGLFRMSFCHLIVFEHHIRGSVHQTLFFQTKIANDKACSWRFFKAFMRSFVLSTKEKALA